MIEPNGVVTTPDSRPEWAIADDELRRCVEQIVTRERGVDRSGVVWIERRREDDGSSYACEAVTAHLVDGAELRLFRKSYGSSRFAKDEPRQQRDCELRVYRDLLAGADVGTATYYGSAWNESRGWFWLFLEYVPGTPLAYCALEYWLAAAGWLGRLHGHFTTQAERIRASDFLPRYDADFLRSKARQAVMAASTVSPAAAERLRALVSRYDRYVEVMANQPPMLVHGSYKPRHILIDVDTMRICPVDWELAGVGSGLYDLAFLAHGFGGRELDQLLDAYRRAAVRHCVALPEPDQMRCIVDCFRLHRVLKALGRSAEREFPESRVMRMVESCERLDASLTHARAALSITGLPA